MRPRNKYISYPQLATPRIGKAETSRPEVEAEVQTSCCCVKLEMYTNSSSLQPLYIPFKRTFALYQVKRSNYKQLI